MREMAPEDFENYEDYFSVGDSLPVFANAKEGLEFMESQEQAAIRELHEEAKRAMAADQEDPRTQQYFMRMDKKTVVQTDKEYGYCLKNGIAMKVIPYSHALQTLKVEEARAKQKLKAKNKKKAARASRKKNRR